MAAGGRSVSGILGFLYGLLGLGGGFGVEPALEPFFGGGADEIQVDEPEVEVVAGAEGEYFNGVGVWDGARRVWRLLNSGGWIILIMYPRGPRD
jgi:hypothetical protein